jgi:archaellum component FlaF (FlaF/FlaG flagellin family)
MTFGHYISGLLVAIAVVSWALAQTGPFQPGSNPSSNQAWNSVAVTPAATPIPVTRALYNGNPTACTIVITPNGSTTQVSFLNVQPGELLPVQATVVAASSTCGSIVALY